MDNNMFIFPGQMAVHWCVGTSLASNKDTEWTYWISAKHHSTVQDWHWETRLSLYDSTTRQKDPIGINYSTMF